MTLDTAVTPLPSIKDVRDLFIDLMDRDVTVAHADPWTPTAVENAVWGVFVSASDTMVGAAVTDFPLSAYAGAAIGLVPPTGAAIAIEENELSAMLRENVHEILNITSALLNMDGAPHIRLADVHGPDPSVPSDVVELLATRGRRLDLQVDIAGYGGGKLSIALVV